MLRWLGEKINLWVILVAMLVAGGLIVLFGLLVLLLPLPAVKGNQASVIITVIAAPTQTPIPTIALETPTPTPPPSVGGISIGSYVQISGTDGAGLRLRSGPGTTNPQRFLGMDAEVFQVKEGPKTADGFTWWYLEAPYDPQRTGWAASEYLKVVSSAELTPTSTSP